MAEGSEWPLDEKTAEEEGAVFLNYIGVSITARDSTELQQQLLQLVQLPLRSKLIIEWRLDCWQNQSVTSLQEANLIIKERCSAPLLITLRTMSEGGYQQIDTKLYVSRIRKLMMTLTADYWDVQWQSWYAKTNLNTNRPTEKPIIWSYHVLADITAAEIVSQVRLMSVNSKQSDWLKVAIIANTADASLKLLQATWTLKQILKNQLVTMAMGELGQSSRLLGPIFGSCLSFGSLTPKGSAPGQIPLAILDDYLTALK